MTSHQSVLLNETIEWLNPNKNGVYIDGTFGRGGYTRAILAKGGIVFAFDRDGAAIASGAALKAEYKDKLTLIQDCFSNMDQHGIENVDGVALDLGVSSPQLDEAERGFSFRHDGPLDMRMGQDGTSAADLVNRLSETELADIIFNYGEERLSRRVARAIVAARLQAPITRTTQLADIVRSVVPASRDGIHPATRTFQGLRIAVNDELGELEKGLQAAEKMLKHGGRLVVVSFHSLEDRMVKNFMKTRGGKAPMGSRHAPANTNTESPAFRILTPKPIEAGEAELQANPRASSAKLRAAERIFSEIATDSPKESLGVNPSPRRK